MIKPLRQWSLAARFATVTLVALIAATLVNFAVTFSGPPPMRRPVQLTELLPVLARDAQIPRSYSWVSGPVVAASFAGQPDEILQSGVADELARRLGAPAGRIAFAASSGRGGTPRDDASLEARDGFTLGLRQTDGSWRIVRGKPAPVLTTWHLLTLGLTLASAIFFGLLALLVARSVVRPLNRLGYEADSAGLGRTQAITAGGPPEVARVARAVAGMQGRLAGALDDRTAMLTAVAHDMAAPLARLRFRIDSIPEPHRESAERDIAELTEMVTGIVEFAATGRTTGPFQKLDAVTLARQLAAQEDMAVETTLKRAMVVGDEIALRRLLTNLCVNARRYGGGGEISVQRLAEMVRIEVSDRGPGFPSELAERLFDPFFRVEASRNRTTAGAGLGLAIARGIAEVHGGTLRALPRDGGGSVFVLELPGADRW